MPIKLYICPVCHNANETLGVCCERVSGSYAASGSACRLGVEAVGETPEDAIGYALRVIALLNQHRDTKGTCCGGTSGNGAGKWDELPNNGGDR